MTNSETGRGRSSRQRQPGPTVADVARRAGVSPMTVSRVTNGQSNVLPDTRRKVEAAIAELGYVPNLAARSLAGARPVRIALLHSNPSAAYLSEFLVGSLAESTQRGVQLVVEFFDQDMPHAAFAGRLASRRVEGVLLPPPLCDDAQLIEALQQTGLALAQVATGSPNPAAHAVAIDDEQAAYAMTRRLIAHGHTSIGFIAGDPNQTASARRRNGYLRALAEAGLPASAALIAQGNFTYRSGWEEAEKLLALDPRPTAIFASNDDMAAATVATAHRARIEVPGELAVVGFDDTMIATTVWPELTTIRQPVAEMARRAIALLADSITSGGELQPKHEQMEFELIERESDAASKQ